MKQTAEEHQHEALLHEREAARLLGVSVSGLRRRRALRQPPEWVRIGGRVLYRPSVLAAFIEQSAVRLPAAAVDGGAVRTETEGVLP